MLRPVLFVFIILLSSGLKAQEDIKYERETKISKEEFPAGALEVIRSLLEQSGSIKFYRETNQDGINYEAKLKINKVLYSIEFDSFHKLKDVEALLKWNKAREVPKESINNSLSEVFAKYKVMRVQKQYIFNNQVDQLVKLPPSQDILVEINYEIEIEGLKHQGDELRFYELLFDEKGELVKQRTITKVMNDNLIF
jgi:hypothetical protein